MNNQKPYRGISVETGKFVYGGHCVVQGKHYIIPDDATCSTLHTFGRNCGSSDCIEGFVEVIPSSVGQATGLKDKNDSMIYEGDICNIHIFTQELGENMGVMEGEREFVAEICFDCICGLSVKNKNGDSGPLYMYGGFEDSEEQIEIIGNIHQHPELLEAK